MNSFVKRVAKKSIAVLLAAAIFIGSMAGATFADDEDYYTITVKDDEGNLLDNVSVSYNLTLGASGLGGSTVLTCAGIAEISDLALSDIPTLGASGILTMSYSLSKVGFYDVNSSFTIGASDTCKILTMESIPENFTLTAVKQGSGKILFNDTETSSLTLQEDTSVGIRVEPTNVGAAKTYIKSLTIGSSSFTPVKYNSFSINHVLTADVEVDAEFYTEYYVDVSAGDGGTITVNDTETERYIIGESNLVNIEVTPDEDYEILSVSVDGVDQTISDPTSFTKSLTLTACAEVEVEFIRLYTVTISKEGNGTASVDDGAVTQSKTVREGTTVPLYVTPDDNYCISSVSVNGVVTSYDRQNLQTIVPSSVVADKDYDVNIVFAKKKFDVNITIGQSGASSGTVAFDGLDVPSLLVAEYGDTPEFIITPGSGSHLADVMLQGTDVINDVLLDGSTIRYTLPPVTATTSLAFDFVSDGIASVGSERLDNDYYSISFSKDISRQEMMPDNTLLVVVPAGTTYTFTPKGIYKYISVNRSSIRTIFQGNAAKLVERIDVSVKSSKFGPKNNVFTINDKINIKYDTTLPGLELTPATANANGYYNSDVSVAYNVSDDEDNYSGIKSIEYWVKNAGTETQRETVYNHTAGNPNISSRQGSITVLSSLNNSDAVEVFMKVTDMAGNEKTTSVALKINAALPVVSVSIGGALDSGATTGYYNATRTATLTITDRATTFDAAAATAGFAVTAMDADGNALEITAASIIGDWSSVGDVHTATLTFSESANYVWSFAYTNKAGLANDGILTSGDSVYDFTVDTIKPTASISAVGKTWNTLASSLVYGVWSKDTVVASVSADDTISPIYDVLYMKSNSTTPLTVAQLNTCFIDGLFQSAPTSVEEAESFTVYARITDYAGNVQYISTNGIIYDERASLTELTYDLPNGNGLYNGDVDVDISVNDIFGTETYSGIKRIDYTVTNNGNVTQSGNLYTMTNALPLLSDLVGQWEGGITVDSSLNNSDSIMVTVVAFDLAGNRSEATVPLAINIDIPEININVSGDAAKVEGSRGYFRGSRTATITIEDRATAFDAAAATAGIRINATDALGNAITLDVPSMISSWTSNGNTHTATVTFAADGNYTWSMTYTNKADNAASEPSTAGATPMTFTVDNTAPTGTITVGQSFWDSLLSTITFGLYSNSSVNVSATAADVMSPVIIEYYKTSDTSAISSAELSGKPFNAFSSFSVSGNEQFVVYLKISDYAGNTTYISSDGYIVDHSPASVSLTPDNANKNGVYNKDVSIAVKINDGSPYSGIKLAEYWIERDGVETARQTLLDFRSTAPTQSELVNSINDVIVVNAAANNSSNVIVNVRVVDNAGNVTEENTMLDIDVTAPTIAISYDNNDDNGGNGYFDAARTATVSITERSNHFDPTAATAGISLTAADVNGEEIELAAASMISEWTTEKSAIADQSIHTATISFRNDANYTFAIAYTDMADNANDGTDTGSSVAPFAFAVDTMAPVASISAASEEGREETWSDIVNTLTFGFWSNKSISIDAEYSDVTSPISDVSYTTISNSDAYTLEELEELSDWKSFDGLNIDADEQVTVYLRVTDMAGNKTYVGTDGLIVDSNAPIEESIAPEITLIPEQPVNGIYNTNVRVDINVSDPVVNGAFSGLRNISYEVLNLGTVTQSGVLYTFDEESPSYDGLVKDWSGYIVIDSSLNNSNDVEVIVYAGDNALNSSQARSEQIAIDITAPTINISYNNNSCLDGQYFKADRVATVTVTERNFNADDIRFTIENTDGTMPTVSSWVSVVGGGNGDTTTNTATIVYHSDGDYTFDVEFADMAGNNALEPSYAAETIAPTEFTIDQTSPVINVTYDNNSALEGVFFNAARTATIVITEHNFNLDAIVITAPGAPTATWTESGDTHTGVIKYDIDGDFTFDITASDLAGNESDDANYGASVAPRSFTVDTTIAKPVVSGVENGKAYKSSVTPLVKFDDINYKSYEIKLTRTSLASKDEDVTEKFMTETSFVTTGGTISASNFEEIQDNDGIYTLVSTIVDKAGNSDTTTVKFTVNRFGSVYEYGDYLTTLLNDGLGFVRSITADLQVTEFNADRLVEDSLVIAITRDGKPLDAVRYDVNPVINDTVEEGENGWFNYNYSISKDNFTSDGVYKISISSKDATGNTPENSNYKDKLIAFNVDSTPPEITSVVGLETTIINTNSLTVRYTVFDTINLKSVKVYVDGELFGDEITDFSSDSNNYNGTFALAESGNAQKVRIVLEDMAGNITDTDSDNFTSAYSFNKEVTVSTNIFIRWYANKFLFWGSIIGVVVVAIGAIVVIRVVAKKKKSNGNSAS